MCQNPTRNGRRSLKKARAADLEAYNYYLRGRQLADRLSREGFVEALETFRKAIAIDPGYAPAWAGIVRAQGVIRARQRSRQRAADPRFEALMSRVRLQYGTPRQRERG